MIDVDSFEGVVRVRPEPPSHLFASPVGTFAVRLRGRVAANWKLVYLPLGGVPEAPQVVGDPDYWHVFHPAAGGELYVGCCLHWDGFRLQSNGLIFATQTRAWQAGHAYVWDLNTGEVEDLSRVAAAFPQNGSGGIAFPGLALGIKVAVALGIAVPIAVLAIVDAHRRR